MLSLLAAVAIMVTPPPLEALLEAPLDEETTRFISADPTEFSLPFVRPKQPDVFRWVRMRDPAFNDRFSYAQMNGQYDGLLVELKRSCRELFRSSGAVPLFKDESFFVNGQQCFVKDIYIVPDEAAGRALAVNIMVREAREDGESFPDDAVEAAGAYLDMVAER